MKPAAAANEVVVDARWSGASAHIREMRWVVIVEGANAGYRAGAVRRLLHRG